MKQGASKVTLTRKVARLVLLAVAIAGVAWLALAAADWVRIDSVMRQRCSALRGAKVDQGRVTAADIVSSGFKPSWMTMPIGVWGFDLPESCRLSIVFQPSADSHIESAVWLPTHTWNGRLQGVGNGGLGGSIDKLSMTIPLQHNYAVLGTDTGHRAKDSDAGWALGHPERIKDYGWRALHLTTVAAKLLATRFYGRPPLYSYFVGGSNGGREALMEAQRFPDDYDGIVAGAPSGVDNIPTVTWIQQQLLQRPESYIPERKLPAIAGSVMKACDALDGVADGLVANPTTCRFEPASLLCRGADSDQCLTAPQVASLRAIYDGPPGTVHRGFEKGGEAGWGEWMLGKKPRDSLHYAFSLAFHRNLIYGNSRWEPSGFSFESDRAAATRLLGPDFDARDPDLGRFEARGGKLILYHGWADPALQPGLTIDYFERVRARMGQAAADRFLRLYMVPGMQHVIGGPGPNVFGQITSGNGADPRYSVTAAMEAWVEHGVAPGMIVASKYGSDIKPFLKPGSMKPERTRPLCPYPAVAHWTGRGSTDRWENFVCTGEGK